MEADFPTTTRCSPIGYKAIFTQNMGKSSSERGFIRYISKHPNHPLKVHLIGISPYTDIGKHLQEITIQYSFHSPHMLSFCIFIIRIPCILFHQAPQDGKTFNPAIFIPYLYAEQQMTNIFSKRE